MVLNDPVDPYATEEPYNPPASSPDPYSNADGFSDQVNGIASYPIDLSLLYSPAPLIGPLFGHGKQKVVSELQRRLAAMSASQQRHLSKDEVDAFTHHFGKSNAIASWGFPAGMILGLYQANQTKEQYGSPFTGSMKRENGWFDGQRIKLWGREILRGDHARLSVHALRTLNHVCLHAGCLGLLASIYAAVVQFDGETRDPRLRDFYQNLKVKVGNATTRDEKMRTAGQGLGHPTSMPAVMEMLEAQSRARGPEATAGTRTAATSPTAFKTDDASPISAEGGYDEFVSDNNTSLSGTTDDAYNNPKTYNYGEFPADNDTDNQPQTQTQNQTRVRKPSSRSSQSSTTRNPPRSYSSPRHPHPDNEPSSPSTDRFSSSPPSSSSSPPDDEPALSAWERIRREAATGDSKWPSGKE